VLLTSEYVVNQDNRFVVGLLNEQAKLVKNAKVHLRFSPSAPMARRARFVAEGDADFFELNIAGAHAHDTSPQNAVRMRASSFYILNTPFDAAGKWVCRVEVTPEGATEPVRIQQQFEVLAKSQTPGIGAMRGRARTTPGHEPRSSTLCSRAPVCSLHDKTIADAQLGKGPAAGGAVQHAGVSAATRFLAGAGGAALRRCPL